LQPISKQDYDFLLKNKLMKIKEGKNAGYIPGSKGKHGKSKPRFVEDKYFYKLYPKLDPNPKEESEEDYQNLL
jgi:hypothetical protein